MFKRTVCTRPFNFFIFYFDSSLLCLWIVLFVSDLYVYIYCGYICLYVCCISIGLLCTLLILFKYSHGNREAIIAADYYITTLMHNRAGGFLGDFKPVGAFCFWARTTDYLLLPCGSFWPRGERTSITSNLVKFLLFVFYCLVRRFLMC